MSDIIHRMLSHFDENAPSSDDTYEIVPSAEIIGNASDSEAPDSASLDVLLNMGFTRHAASNALSQAQYVFLYLLLTGIVGIHS